MCIYNRHTCDMVGDRAGISSTVWGGSPPEANALWSSTDVDCTPTTVLKGLHTCGKLLLVTAPLPVPAVCPQVNTHVKHGAVRREASLCQQQAPLAILTSSTHT